MSSRAGLAWGFVLLLGILHYDFWWWGDRTLVFGFVPIGLAFHALISVLAAGAWAWMIRVGWPSHLEEWAEDGAEGDPR
ncbi:MAG: hypothetical protein AAF682_14030 [Planctomycetota bacterium]